MRLSEIVKKQSNPSADTRKLYSFEANYFWGTPATKVLDIESLRAIAQEIWNKYGKNKPFPKIVAGKGTPHGDRLYSYSQELEDGNYIQLSRNQRNKLVLAHELVHAMGYDLHDSAFVKRYFNILSEILPIPLAELRKAAREYKIDI